MRRFWTDYAWFDEGPSPGPSPRKLRAERGEFECVGAGAARGARPLRVRITRPPSPKLQGEVEEADGPRLDDGHRAGVRESPHPRPESRTLSRKRERG